MPVYNKKMKILMNSTLSDFIINNKHILGNIKKISTETNKLIYLESENKGKIKHVVYIT